MESRSLDDLHPILKEKAIEFKELCLNVGITILIYCTWRDQESQDKAFKEGKSKLKFPNSKHNFIDSEGRRSAKAFDCVPMRGKTAQWNDVTSYAKMGEIGKSIGLRWGGEFKGFSDKPHFEIL